MPIVSMQDHSILVAALRDSRDWPSTRPPEPVECVQTHISSVLLAGDFAYKIKKPLDLGFLDFSTLERRRFCCEEELRLNARLAPSVYLEVVPITGTAERPVIGGEGEPIEHTVKMRRFDAYALLSRHLERLTPELVDAIAERAAAFHGEIPSAAESAPFGTPEAVFFPMQQNFDQIRALVADPGELARLGELEAWTRDQYACLEPLLAERRAGGFIRECHGDMHLGNMVLEQGSVTIFDGIEFNPSLRWIDTVSEVAFLVMDLDEKGRPELGRRFLDRYLARTGDYAGLRLLHFYQVYRAMVRAKVAAIRLGQPGLSQTEKAEVLAAYAGYADLAQGYTRPLAPALVITHGVSGSGKSRAAAALVEGLGAVRARSDVERKRLAGLRAEQASGSDLSGGIYSPELTKQTYVRLRQLCALILDAGLVAVADAAFLKRDQRAPFARLAAERQLPFLILSPKGDESLFHRRVEQRAGAGTDPSEATLEVLEAQLRAIEPLEAEEQGALFLVPAAGAFPVQGVAERLSGHG